MFPTNHNGRTKLKAPSYMMLNPEQQHGPTSSFSVAHSYFQCKNPTHHISPICTLYAFRGSFPIYMDILHIIHNWDIDSLVAIAKRIRPTGRYISTDLMLSDKRPSCHKTEPQPFHKTALKFVILLDRPSEFTALRIFLQQVRYLFLPNGH